DLNGDGKMDIVSGSYTPGDIYWFQATEKGFAAGQVIPETTPSTVTRSASAVSVADWDGDGKLDLLIGNIMGEVYWLKNEGTKTALRSGARQPIYAGGSPLKVESSDTHRVAVDWDGDGVLDLLVGCGGGGVLFCRGERNGDGPPTLHAPVRLLAGGKPISLGN